MFKFFYRNASPPKKVSKIPIENQMTRKQYENIDKDNEADDYTGDLDLFNFGAQKLKYDFFLINEKRIEEFAEKVGNLKNV